MENKIVICKIFLLENKIQSSMTLCSKIIFINLFYDNICNITYHNNIIVTTYKVKNILLLFLKL